MKKVFAATWSIYIIILVAAIHGEAAMIGGVYEGLGVVLQLGSCG